MDFARDEVREYTYRLIEEAVRRYDCDGIYLALLSVYEYPGDTSEGHATDRQKRHERDVMNFYLATSRDGDHWDLRWVYAGEPFVPRGPDSSFDKDIVLPASTIVTHADEHWIYYAGANERYVNEQARFDRQHAIGLAKLKLDRFVSLDAGETPGTVVTRSFKLEGDKLIVNVDSLGGELAVGVLEDAGHPLPGYSCDDCRPLTRCDELRAAVRWKDRDDLSALRGQVIRLEFRLRHAKLYAFTIGSSDKSVGDSTPRSRSYSRDLAARTTSVSRISRHPCRDGFSRGR